MILVKVRRERQRVVRRCVMEGPIALRIFSPTSEDSFFRERRERRAVVESAIASGLNASLLERTRMTSKHVSAPCRPLLRRYELASNILPFLSRSVPSFNPPPPRVRAELHRDPPPLPRREARKRQQCLPRSNRRQTPHPHERHSMGDLNRVHKVPGEEGERYRE